MAAAGQKAPRTASRARAAPRRGVPLASIRLLVLDVDGVLTDGRLRYGPYGERDKVFHVRDGHGIKAVRAAGIDVGVISGRRSAAVQRRCRELGIGHLLQGVEDKGAAFASLIARLGVTASQCACIGDDVPDLPILQQAGLAVAVADAHATALAAAHRRTRAAGGFGAVREVCDWLLAARREP
ncbi:MAG TPA: HAD-IIIA family hydrolase [Steroidobacteraceae bacterium]|jgi:3-deoxy-D-manno-octulosonate 8-phosphate phosphatase (KDO 8-P phosphatase)|nr:HAD-IIIA family hydrolase [Steroidobacteraceae bacterium]